MKRKIFVGLLGLTLLGACSQANGALTSTGWNRIPDDEFRKIETPEIIIEYEAPPVSKPRPEVKIVPTIKNTYQKSSVRPVEPRRAPKLKNVVPKSAAKKYALERIGQSQFNCLNILWNKESGWRYNAGNPSSGAYGIPQALPGSKMATAGDDWRTNPITQVKWGLRYINNRYGSACKAWAFWRNNHWY